jgi:hypothetical protein
MVVIVIAAAATPWTVIRNPEHALDGTHRAADAGADRAADQAANRTGHPIAFGRALLRATHDALCMADVRDREQCDSERRSGEIEPCGRAGWKPCRGDFRVIHSVDPIVHVVVSPSIAVGAPRLRFRGLPITPL